MLPDTIYIPVDFPNRLASYRTVAYHREKTCVWRVQDDLPGSPFADKWQTGCGYEDNAHPDDRDFTYCPYCGGEIKCPDISEGSDE